MQPFQRIRARAMALPVDNIDTDQIIPARFLKITDRAGVKEGLFADWRLDADGQPRPEFPLNQPGAENAQVLVAGHNFGCGSSREHAPWALLAHGFRCVISTGFADIFRANAITNGLLPVTVSADAYTRLLAQIDAPGAHVDVDLKQQQLTLPDGSRETFPIEAFDKHCLLQGVDRLGFLLALNDDIARFEQDYTRGARTLEEQSA